MEASGESKDSSIQVFLDLDALEFDPTPTIKNGHTLVPFRSLFEALGLKVDWDPAERIVTGQQDDISISLQIGKQQAIVNHETLPLQVASEIMDGNTFVPLRFVGEATGALVFWDPYNREISIFTTAFIESNHVTKEDIEKAVEEYLATRAEEEADAESIPIPDPPSESVNRPVKPVNLEELEGMYYGFRSDFGGYECGGMCWDFYTFLPNKQIFIGLPANGGPETIDCKEEECLNYSIDNGQLVLSNNESLPIEISERGFLSINEVRLDAVPPVPNGTTLGDDYIYISYYGLIGITGAATSSTSYLSLHTDGTFELAGVTIGSLGATSDPSTYASPATDSETGTYEIYNNTIKMTANDGTVVHSLFFIHPSDEGDTDDIQIGANNYYVPRD